MNAGPFVSLVAEFAQNWAVQRPPLTVSITGTELDVDEDHPLHGELFALCSGRAASLPFFHTTADVLWCTVAPDANSLRGAVANLETWVLPSFGGSTSGGGYIRPGIHKSGLVSKILAASPDGYYRWRCPHSRFERVLSKLQLLRNLENVRPERAQTPRPSLYELRARFMSALLIGDRPGAEQIISQLDLFQLDTAVNTQFMRIRMWHHFADFEKIRNHSELPHLLAQPLPPRVRTWIEEACGKDAPPSASTTAVGLTDLPAPVSPSLDTWIDWLNAVKAGKKEASEAFLQGIRENSGFDFSAGYIEGLCSCLYELALDDALRIRERSVILPAVAEILDQYVREPGFPRPDFANFYLHLLRLWSLLHRGNSAGQEHGHVLLELASALLQINSHTTEVCQTLEEWWKAKAAPSQLYFALDAIELMEREVPDLKPAVNLWVEAADFIKRGANALAPADRELWRRVGIRLGFDNTTIAEYLPLEAAEESEDDLLAAAGLKHVAIVCLRDKQAKIAAEEIEKRSGAKVSLVTTTTAGAQTTQACTADVVLFVWLASTHAVFRAFDQFDRKRFCYVQGTGGSSIVRSLERWVTDTNGQCS